MFIRGKHVRLMDPDPNGEGGGDDNADPKGGDDISALKDTLEGALGAIKTLGENQANFQTQITQAIQGLANAGKKDDVPDDELGPSDDDLETMPRAQLVQHITQTVMKGMGKQINELTTALKTVDGRVTDATSRQQVEDFKKDHSDLLEWREEIGKVFKEGRANNVADAYLLVRTADPDKAKKMDVKYAPPDPNKDKGKDKDEGFKGVFKGFNTGGSAKNGDKTTKMKSSDAAAAAWDEATAGIPGIEQFLNS